MNKNSYIQLKELNKTFNETVAVNNINLEIYENEFFVLLGPSGCGKSTTLRMIAGLEDITSGEVIANKINISQLDPKDRNMAFVFQNYALYPHMNVRKNISYSLKLRKVSHEEMEKKIHWVSNLLKIDQLLDRKPSQLSGGQRQRVALGRSLVRDPVAFLLDEPLSNLDAQLRVEMRHELIKLQKNLAKTFIYVTHDQIEAMTMASRICIMNNGNILQIGTPKEVYEKPNSVFVARFIANPVNNILTTNIKHQNHSHNLECLNIELKRECLTNRDLVYFSIRPENFYIEKKNSGMASLKVEILQIENHGHDHLISSTIENNNQKIYFRLNKFHNLIIGESINIYFNTNDILLFDINSEEAI